METSLLQERIGEGIRVIEVLRQTGAELWVSARDLTRHVPVVLRALDLELVTSPDQVRYFEAQATQAVGFRHLNIATAQPLQRRPNLVFYALNVGFAKMLESVLEEGSRLSFEQSLDILRGIASALDYAHAHGMAHGRLSPEMIFVDSDDVMVSGFVAVQDAESAGATSASPYRAPEQGAWRYEADDRADVYAMGVIAFELISSKRVPILSSIHVSFADPFNIARDVPLRAGLSLHVNEAILRAVAKRPSLRFPSGEDFVFALETSRSERATPASVAKAFATMASATTEPAIPAPETTPVPRLTQLQAPLLPIESERVVRPRRFASAIGIGAFCVIGAFTLVSMRKGINIPQVSSAIAGTLSRLTTRVEPADSSAVMVPPSSASRDASAGIASSRRRRTAISSVGVENGEVGSPGEKGGDSLAAHRRYRAARDNSTTGWMGILENVQFRISADTSTTVRQTSSIVKVWVKTEFAKSQKISDNDNRVFVSSVNHYKLNCDAGTTSVGPGAFYDAAGSPIMSIASGYAPMQQPSTGTPAEQILARVCGVLRARLR
jgi:serine/threonine protein kinase